MLKIPSRYLLFFLCCINLPTLICAQLISVKSLPVATGDQFLIFPSKNMAMGNVNLALADPWLRPFENPGFPINKHGTVVFIQPAFYSISNSLGSARTLPISIFGNSGSVFGNLTASFQQIEAAGSNNNFNTIPWPASQNSFKTDHLNTNTYLFTSLGLKLPYQGLTFGTSLFWADLNAVGGVDLLYTNNSYINQNGEIYELRSGLLYSIDGASFEAVALYNDFEMMHEVTYERWIFNDFAPDIQTDVNLDKTRTYGLSLKYTEHIEQGPLIAALTTYNYKTHPKIPNYSIMNIPRDPGHTHAFNLGLGMALQNEQRRFGVDFIFEPMWSDTWVKSPTEQLDLKGNLILAGEKTIENLFTFNNWILKCGYNRNYTFINWSIGLQLHNYAYSLKQNDYINLSSRSQQEDWTEYIWSWGIGLKFRYFNLAYNARILTGAGIPNTLLNGWTRFTDGPVMMADFIAAPSGKMRIDYQNVYTHQFVLQIPLNAESL